MTAEPATDAPQFALVLSEKGGAERREIFRAAEITLGRVQGNDLVLAKGNVSKRHARILYREGRFIVTDLNSTNGTYVNRRRIAQATIIREDDRIYVGDFVIRVVAEVGDSPSEEQSPDTPTGNHEATAAHTIHPDTGERPSAPAANWERISAAEELSRTSQAPSPPGVSSTPPASRGISEPPGDSSQRFSDMASGHRRAVAEAVDSAFKDLTPPPLVPDDDYQDSVRTKIEQLVDRMLVGGQIPVGTSAEAVAEQAIDEILDLGPLAELLQDPAVTSISAARYDALSGTRDGRQQSFPPGFSRPETFELALKRLCASAGQPLLDEEVVERTLPDGTRVSVVRGQVSPGGPLMAIRKPRKITSSLDDLVRRGAISRGMATFLAQCVAGNLNILIVGPRDEGANIVLSALCSSAHRERIVAATDFDDLSPTTENVVRLDLSHYKGEARRLLEIASSVPQTRLAVTLTSPELSAATLEATGTGMSGLLASLNAANLNRGLLRLPADIVAERSGMSLEAAVGWVLSAFDVVIEVTRLRDGRVRVLRVGELSSATGGGIQVSDIFRFVVSRVAAGGAVEGTFVPSGHTPRIVGQLEALGMRIDASLFVRTPTRSQ